MSEKDKLLKTIRYILILFVSMIIILLLVYIFGAKPHAPIDSLDIY